MHLKTVGGVDRDYRGAKSRDLCILVSYPTLQQSTGNPGKGLAESQSLMLPHCNLSALSLQDTAD